MNYTVPGLVGVPEVMRVSPPCGVMKVDTRKVVHIGE